MDHYEEIRLVEELGSKIGYGNMMSIASALWAKKLSDYDGSDLSSGAFVPAIMPFIKDEYKDSVEQGRSVERSWVDNYYEMHDRTA